MNSIKRFWLYAVTLITLGIFAVGVGDLLNLLFGVLIKGTSDTLIVGSSYNQQQLSLGIAMTVIGGPLWFFFWRAIQRRAKASVEETGSGIRKLYLNYILVMTAFMSIIAAGEVLKWLLSGAAAADYSPASLTLIVVAGIVWYYHWKVSESEGQPSPVARTLRRWYMYALSGFGLIWLAIGLVQLINTAFVSLPIWGNVLVEGHFWGSTVQLAVAQILLGAGTWYLHWFRMSKDDLNSTLRQVYFYLLTITGGAVTALVSSIILFYRFFNWIFGGAPVAGNPHFQFLGWAVPAILVGIGIWGYHLRLAQEEAGRVQEKRQSAQRVYYYLMAFLGLSTLAVGLSVLLGIFVDTGTALTGTSGWWRTQLALCLSLISVGLPLWLYYWNGILKRVQSGGITEWRALSRRIFLYVVIGVSIIMLTADLVNVVSQLLRGIMQSNLNTNFFHDAKWSLQTLIIAAFLLWYHWQVLRADQRRGTESVVQRRNVILFADDPLGELSARLENKLGYKITNLYPTGVNLEKSLPLPDEEIDRLVAAIQSGPVNKVMLVMINGKVSVLPYQDKK
jgi:hypothetical protein